MATVDNTARRETEQNEGGGGEVGGDVIDIWHIAIFIEQHWHVSGK